MMIKAMKQALETLESWQKTCLDCGRSSDEPGKATKPVEALRRAIQEAEKQESDLLEALSAISRYGWDTLSGRADGGVDDRNWQRTAVREMTRRADAAIAQATRGKTE